jgi:hypothetical protein
MALEVTSTSPCDLLNASGYPKLFLVASTTSSTGNTQEAIAYDLIAKSGTLVKYVDSLAASTMSNPILANAAPTSRFRLVQFLSGAGVASTAPGAASTSSPSGGSSATTGEIYSTLGAVALKNSSGQYEGIIDNYIAPMVSNYLTPTFSSGGASLVSDSKFWSPADIVNGMPQANATSVLGKLIKAGYLLSESQVYTPTQMVAGAKQPTSGTESLIYLYNLAQKGTLSPTQQSLQTKLEATNLRFFGAFMAEYCYYRTRYEWLLIKFFQIYSTPTTGANAYSSTSSSVAAANILYGTGRPFPSTSTATSLTQSDYIAGLAYQMACLNMRLADMRTLLSKINLYYNGVFTNIQSDINSSTASGSNKKLTQTITALQTSAAEANTYLTETDFAQEAMKYNSEKNRYSNILLGFYAFLNIAALATVFQLARN